MRSPWRTRAGTSRRRLAVFLLPLLLAAATGLVNATGAQAAVACRVAYTVASQWSNGFTGDVTISNLGDAVNGWRLSWAFGAGQQISQAWNGTYSQSGAAVTVSDAGYNAAIPAGGSASFGFNASWSGSNPAPAAFSLNGVPCTGTPGSPTPTPTPTPTPPPSGDAWNPPANLVTPLNQVWQHVESTYPNLYGFRNYIWDQIMAGKGNINYCVRWDSGARVSAALRDRVQANLARQFNKWIDQLQGWNGWPYPDVNVKVVGWAVRDRGLLEWTDNSVDVYVGDINENAPQCAPPCGRFFHQDGDYSGCPGGAAHHYDLSLWLTAGMTGGAGGDWGERIGSEYYVGALDSENIHILLHEIGHGFGIDDFYDWTPTGVCCFIMNAGSATQITEFDKWMLRDWWRHLKNRYGY
ncbi:cellulose-binding domain-containing protein [Sphaerisporangium fuscum]|uniref:cellulose-binding domain-containing protein n=1 Tax=Sphaerisporangium fuscum TaxID=2835868 RepID=UPI001BDD2E78|nr:cellulose-binding domain-containing protein [Sphaerisporangium fuscum]